MVQQEDIESEEEKELDEEEKRRLEEEEEQKRKQEEEEAAAAAAAAAKTKGGPGKKSQPEVDVIDPDMPDPNDPNGQKFIPDLIHFDKAKHQSTEPFDNLVRYQLFLKDEEKFNLIFDDCSFDTKQG